MATIDVEGRRAEVEDGKRLVLAIEEDLGVDILHKCGGNAMCTTCRVQFEVGEPSRMTEAERERLIERELLGQARLSCQIPCEGEMLLKPLMTVSSSGTDSPGPRRRTRSPPSRGGPTSDLTAVELRGGAFLTQPATSRSLRTSEQKLVDQWDGDEDDD